MADNTLSGIGTLIGGAGGLLGALLSSGNNSGAQQMQAGIDAINALQIPDTAKALLIQQYQQSGTLSPALVAQLPLNADQKTLLTENPQNRANQQTTLNALQQLSQNGMSAQDQAQAAASRQSVAQDENAANASLQQQAQQRGQGSSGNTLAMQLAGNQNAAQTASANALQQAASSAAARQQALTNFGNQATAVRGQDYNTQAFNTQNDILRQQFLDQNAIGRQNANVAATNQANQLNLARQQAVSDANTQAANAELARQAQAQQQMYYDQYLKANALLNGGENQAKLTNSQNAANASALTAGATGLGGILNGIGQIANTSNPGSGNTNNASQTPSTAGGQNANATIPPPSTQQAQSNTPIAAPANFQVAPQSQALPNPQAQGSPVPTSSAGEMNADGTISNGQSLPPGMTADMIEKQRKQGVSEWHGGIIPGKAKVPGNSPKNDTVKLNASPGEMVIPRSKMKNPVDAKEFVDKHFNGKSNNTGFANDPNKHTAILDLIATLHSKKLRGNTGLS